VEGSDTKDVLDDLPGPTKFSNDLFVGESGQGLVTPGVDGDLVSTGIFGLKGVGESDDTRADDKECCLEVHLIEVLQKVGGIVSGTIVESEAPVVFGVTITDILRSGASSAGPPAAGPVRVIDDVKVRGAATRDGEAKSGDLNTRVLDFLDPSLDFGRIDRRDGIEFGVVRRVQDGDIRECRGTSNHGRGRAGDSSRVEGASCATFHVGSNGSERDGGGIGGRESEGVRGTSAGGRASASASAGMRARARGSGRRSLTSKVLDAVGVVATCGGAEREESDYTE